MEQRISKDEKDIDQKAVDASPVSNFEIVSVPHTKDVYTITDGEDEAETKTTLAKNPSKAIPIALIDNIYMIDALKNIIPTDRLQITIEGEYSIDMENKFAENEDNFPQYIIVGGEWEFENSYKVIKWLRSNYFYKAKIIYLSETEDQEHILKVLKLGVKSIIFRKKYPAKVVLSEIFKVIDQEREYVFDDVIVKTLLDSIQINRNNKATSLPENLTKRDKEIIRMIIEEKKGSDIAAELDMNVRTLEGAVNAIFAKFQVSSRVGLVVKALRAGFE